jgi:osmotically inducible lipoprotein OsmB
MKLTQRPFIRLVAAGAVLATLAGGAQAADRKTTNTLIGAAIGAVGGALISNGDPIMTIGGAAAGGLIGNVATQDRRDYGYRGNHHASHRGDHRDYRDQRRVEPNRAWQRDDRAWQRDNRAWQDSRRGQPRQVYYGRPGDDRYYGYR